VNDVDQYIRAVMAESGTPGVSLGVLVGSDIVLARGYGLSNVELSVSARERSVYMLGSISKHIVAAGVLRLIEEGKLELDRRISQHLRYLPKSWSEITVFHLLTHTAGLERDGEGYDPYKQRSIAEIISASTDKSLLFIPGSDWSYSNLGYFILAQLIEAVSGEAFHAFFAAQFFRPLKMGATRTMDNFRIVRNRAGSYFSLGGELFNAGGLIGFRPSGAFVSTVEDMLVWDNALRSKRLLSDESQLQMFSPVQLSSGRVYPYGFGWEIETLGTHDLAHHGGGLWCFRCEYVRCVDPEVSVIVLGNHKDFDAQSVAFKILGMYIPELCKDVVRRSAIKTCFDVVEKSGVGGQLSFD